MTEMTSSSPELNNEELREWLGSIRDLIPTDVKLNWLREPGLVELAANIQVQLDYLKRSITFQAQHNLEKKIEHIKSKDAEYDLAERVKEAREKHRRQRELERAEETIERMRAAKEKAPSPFAGLGI